MRCLANSKWSACFLLAGMLWLAKPAAAQWPQFRGPDFNPATDNNSLPDRWSTTENVEWATDIDGRGWSSPIVSGGKVFVTSVTTEGKSKPPQVGTEYSNAYVKELTDQGLSEEEVTEKVIERDIELPEEVTLDYYLICLDLESGQELWKRKFFTGHPPGGRHRKNSYCSETPTTDGKSVFVYVANLGLYAFDLEGNPQWTTELSKHPIYLDFGTGTSPVLCEGRLIVCHDNEESSFLAAFDTESGRELWRTPRKVSDQAPAGLPKSGWVTPFIWRNALRTEIVTVQPGMAISYDLQGQELWRMGGCSPAPAASSFAYDGRLYINGGRQFPFYAIEPGAAGDITPPRSTPAAGEPSADADASPTQPGEDAPAVAAGEPAPQESVILWKRPRTGTYIPTPVAYQGALYIVQDNGILQRLETESGNQSFKARIKTSGADFTTSPWAYNGRVFCLSEQGDTYVFEAGPEYKLLHVNPLGDFTMASPAIVGDRLLIRTEKKLYSIRQGKSDP